MILHAHADADRLEPLDLVGRDLEYVLERPAQVFDGCFRRDALHDLDVALDLLVPNRVLRQRPAGVRDPLIDRVHLFVRRAAGDHLLAEAHGLVHVVAEPLRRIRDPRGGRVDVRLIARVAVVVLDAQAQRQLAGAPEVLRDGEVRAIGRGQVRAEPIAARVIDDGREAERDRVIHVVGEAALHALDARRAQHERETRAVRRDVTGLGRRDARGLERLAARVVHDAARRIADLDVDRMIGHRRAELGARRHASLGELPRRPAADRGDPFAGLRLLRGRRERAL